MIRSYLSYWNPTDHGTDMGSATQGSGFALAQMEMTANIIWIAPGTPAPHWNQFTRFLLEVGLYSRDTGLSILFLVILFLAVLLSLLRTFLY